MPFKNVHSNQLRPYEQRFLHNWCMVKGQRYFYKFRLMPEVVLNEYKQYQLDKQFDTSHDTDLTRFNSIKLYIDFILVIFPKYKRLLRLWNMKGQDIAKLFGYTTASWHSSYKKITMITSIVSLVTTHEATLNRLNNPQQDK